MARRRDNRQGGLFIEYRTDENGKSVPKSESWVAQYYVDGKRFRRSTGTSVKSEAEAILRSWMADSEKGLKAAPQTQGLMYETLRADLLTWYGEQEHKSLKRRKDGTPYLYPLTALDNFFAKRKANTIDRYAASAFVASRRKAGISNDAINNSLRLLRRMFTLARDTGKLTNVPKFELLRGKSRSGFLPPESFQALVNAIPVRFVPLLVLLYQTGVRVGEAEKIEWTEVDLDAAKITLLEGQTKNDESRILPLSDELVKLLSAEKKREGRIFPSKRAMQAVFPAACKEAGIEGLLIHDLRRSAVRNLRKAGVAEGVAMKISGHRDRTVFERYNIVSHDDVLDAGKLLQRAHAPVKTAGAPPTTEGGSSMMNVVGVWWEPKTIFCK